LVFGCVSRAQLLHSLTKLPQSAQANDWRSWLYRQWRIYGGVCVVVFYAMSKLQTRQLKLTGHMAHSLARGRKEIHAASSQFLRLGLGEIPAIAYDDSIFKPAGQRSEQLAIIHRSGGESEGTQPLRFLTLHVQLKAIPPPMPFLDFRAHARKVRCWRARAT